MKGIDFQEKIRLFEYKNKQQKEEKWARSRIEYLIFNIQHVILPFLFNVRKENHHVQ